MVENDVENAQPGGAAGAPTPQASSGDGQRPSVDPAAIAAAFKDPAVLKVLEDLVGRRLQGEKDRRINKLETKVGDFESVLTEYQELRNEGLPHSRAVREMRTSRMLEQLGVQPETGTPQPPAGMAPAQPAAVAEADETLLAVLGIAPNDPEWVNLLRAGIGTQEQAIELAKRRKSRAPAPNLAGVLPVSSGQSVPPGETVEDIDRKLRALDAQPRWKLSRTEYDKLLARRKELLDQAK